MQCNVQQKVNVKESEHKMRLGISAFTNQNDIEKFLKSLKMNKWNGDIFLEYGINWKDKLLRDLKWVESFIKSI